jgi:glutamine phosphoribosylpyrophosphate amidotransferase
VDTPTREELIASSNSPEEIRKFLGADSLGYVSLPALRQAVNDTEGKFCTSCYTGVYPTDLVQLEVRESNGNAPGVKNEAGNGSALGNSLTERPVAVEREG